MNTDFNTSSKLRPFEVRLGITLFDTFRGNLITVDLKKLREFTINPAGFVDRYRGAKINKETLEKLGFSLHHDDAVNDLFLIRNLSDESNIENGFPILFFQESLSSARGIKAIKTVQYIHQIQSLWQIS